MMKKCIFLIFLLLLAVFAPDSSASENAFVSVVNPVRGGDFWSIKNQYPQTAVLGQIDILKKNNLSATWLIRYDALNSQDIIDSLNTVPDDEKGLFLEITPSWTNDSGVIYRKGKSWHEAGSAFLTGYERKDREKLVDTAFYKFKKLFNYYPKSVGAWWIDGYSLEYMQKKYAIKGALIVADQYTTDNYQIWGQYWSTPYYPSKKDALNPFSNKENKLSVVMMQWAARDPVNGYGNGVQESTYSVQVNDYIDYHELTSAYFSKLVDIYTLQPLNSMNHLVVGLENSYLWEKYKNEYEKQIKILAEKNSKGQFGIVTMGKFADWYQTSFPDISPAQIVIANDPLGSDKKAVWFMNPYYRVGWFYNRDGSVIRDIRQYVDGEEEICYTKACDQLNFATFATRVLDDVTYHTKWIIDEGNIKNVAVGKDGEKYVISYATELGKDRKISFLPRDLEINGKISSIDGAILDAVSRKDKLPESSVDKLIGSGKIDFSVMNKIFGLSGFLLFIFFVIFVPGFVLIKSLEYEAHNVFLAIVLGLTSFTLSFYALSILNLKILIFGYPVLGILLLILKRNYFKEIFKSSFFKFESKQLLLISIIILGTIFQILPVFKSGLKYDFGVGFWGPNTHDGVWHLALINQLTKGVPPQNPIFSQEVLSNYHYFYDLLVAATGYISQIEISDLVFRFYPVLFSLLLGMGSYILCGYIFQKKEGRDMACAISLFLVYFSGSLGWIVEYISKGNFGGESAFWANQAVSFNLNPPFAISLIIVIAIIIFLTSQRPNRKVLLTVALLSGTLVGFKAYAAVIVIGALFLTGITMLIIKKRFEILIVFVISAFLTILYIFMNGFKGSVFMYSPLWFINSMIDSPDRVGWERLSLARYYSLERKEWFKYIGVEAIGVFIFIIGNLNMRVVGLIKFFDLKRIKSEVAYLFIVCLGLTALLIPLAFIQSGTPWNTIQFFYYFMYLCAVLSGPALFNMIRGKYKLFTVPIFLLLIIAPINSVMTAKGYLSPLPHARITQTEMDGLEFLSRQPDGVVLTYPYNKELKSLIREPWPISIYDTTSYVAAFSKKIVFVEDESQNDILMTNYKKRLIGAKDFFLNPESTFLKEKHIKYIYIPKIDGRFLNESELSIDNIFENSEVIIYRVNK